MRAYEMTEQFEEVKSKLDEKADKSDIVRMENELKPKVNTLFDEYNKHTDIIERIEKEVS
jgi:predicted nuclease with TOPRIM domain